MVGFRCFFVTADKPRGSYQARDTLARARHAARFEDAFVKAMSEAGSDAIAALCKLLRTDPSELGERLPYRLSTTWAAPLSFRTTKPTGRTMTTTRCFNFSVTSNH